MSLSLNGAMPPGYRRLSLIEWIRRAAGGASVTCSSIRRTLTIDCTGILHAVLTEDAAARKIEWIIRKNSILKLSLLRQDSRKSGHNHDLRNHLALLRR